MYMAATHTEFEVEEVGVFKPDFEQDVLESGEIGYVVTKLKDIHDVHVGDTLMFSHAHVPISTISRGYADGF